MSDAKIPAPAALEQAAAAPTSAALAADAEARRRIRSDLDQTLLVEAAAGTGKTTELVARLLALLRTGRARLDQILAVTFTDKAAGEMKLRLRGELEKARQDPAATAKEQARFIDALGKLEAAQIGTIHSVCADLLRERPIEARVDPLFEVAAGEIADRLFDEAFDTWFQAAVAAPPEGVRRLLRRRPRGRDKITARDELRRSGRDLCERRDFPAPFRRDPFDRSGELARIAEKLAALATLASRAHRADDWLAKSLAELARFSSELQRRESSVGRDEDGLEADLRELFRHRLWNWRGGGRWYGKGLERTAVVQQRDELKLALEQLVEHADADLAACLREDLRPLVQAHEEAKARAGSLDFLDLLLRTRDLVQQDRGARAELQERFTHLLVDEFQDTDPLQAEILLLLAADDPAETQPRRARPKPGKLFLVGDPKQSIYRFRRADIALYEQVKEQLRGAQLLHLSRSFRGVPGIQQAVNAAFAPRMVSTAERSQAQYVALDPARPDPAGRPSIVALPAPILYGDRGTVVKWKIEESYPDAVGAFVDWLVTQSGWTVTERDKPDLQVPVEARHVCLLFKRLQSFGEDTTRRYVTALEARRIPHVLVGGRSYHAREEILAMRNAAQAIEWPDDELRVFATLRGPFFALGDDALLAFRHRFGRLNPLWHYGADRPQPSAQKDPALPAIAMVATAPLPVSPEVQAVVESLGVLRDLHRGRNRVPLSATLARLLQITRAHAGIAIAPAGEQALANVLRILDLARRFEAAGATSFRAFVERLEADAEGADTADAPVVEEGTEGVRIMSVHKAKGLEFPVVILCDPTAPAQGKTPSHHLDPERGLWALPLAGCAPWDLLAHRAAALQRDRDEAVRVAYVAATRARDLLVIPVAGDGPQEGWLEPLHPAVHPAPERRQEPGLAPGCPPFGRDSVLNRPEEAELTAQTVAPGLHLPQAGAHRVVWWDPHVLELDKEPGGGLRREALLVEDEGGEVSGAVAAAHASWRDLRAQVNERAAAPGLRIATATQLAAARTHAPVTSAPRDSALGARPAPQPTAGSAAPAPQLPPVRTERVAPREEGRPHGKRFGILVHSVLAEVPLQADPAQVAQAAALRGRALGASEPEVQAATRAAQAALAHPLLQQAARSADCRREVDLYQRLPDGTLLEGVADLAFREQRPGGPCWIVVDFKTDARPELEAAYRVQLQLYAEAIARATGEEVEAVLLAV